MKHVRFPFICGMMALAVVIVGVGLLVNRKDAVIRAPTAVNMSAISDTVATNNVSVSNYMFMPMVITVKAGTTVIWTNTDQAEHSVTVDSGSGPNSSLFGQSQTYTYTFAKAGTYTYHCDVHPQMHGTVTVTD